MQKAKIFYSPISEIRRFTITSYADLLQKSHQVISKYYTTPTKLIFTYEDVDGDNINFDSSEEYNQGLKYYNKKKEFIVIKCRVVKEGSIKDKVNEFVNNNVSKVDEFMKSIPDKVKVVEKFGKEIEKEIPKVINKIVKEVGNTFSSSPPVVTDPSPSAPVIVSNIHKNIICDYCKCCPIVGLRYKSLTKRNFDLCQGCFERRNDIGLSKDSFDIFDKPNNVISTFINDDKQKVEESVKPKEEIKPVIYPKVEIKKTKEDLIIEEVMGKYGTQIKLLEQMGFNDRKRSIMLLYKHGGNMPSVVKEYIE